MAFALRIRRRLWVAFAAIAASLPGTAGAATEPRCEAMPAGCLCCEEASPASPQGRMAPALSVASGTRDMTVGCPASSVPCVCRAESPTAPAQKSGQQTEERRDKNGRDHVAADLPAYTGHRAPVAIAFMPDVGPPRSPLYLRTSRLLI